MYKKIGRFTRYIILVFLLVSAKPVLFAQQGSVNVNNSYEIPEIVINNFNLFEKDDILELTLIFDISRYMEEKPDDEYLDALLSYKYNETDSITKKIRVRARGNFRYRTCEFPPLRLNFEYTGFGFSDLDSLRNVKMVTHCTDSIICEDYLMREYLIYKLYNIVTDYSFRVRFLKVRYIDTGSRGLNFQKYAFVIEPMDRLLIRLDATEIEDEQLNYDDVDKGLIDKLAIFQMLTGNFDWFLPTNHNIKTIKVQDPEGSSIIPVPYDFDYSGFVNAYYATHVEGSGTSVKDRVYLGPSRSREEIILLLDEFLEYKKAFLDEVRNFKYLDRTIRRELINYINSFYKLYKNEILLNRILEDSIKRNPNETE